MATVARCVMSARGGLAWLRSRRLPVAGWRRRRTRRSTGPTRAARSGGPTSTARAPSRGSSAAGAARSESPSTPVTSIGPTRVRARSAGRTSTGRASTRASSPAPATRSPWPSTARTSTGPTPTPARSGGRTSTGRRSTRASSPARRVWSGWRSTTATSIGPARARSGARTSDGSGVQQVFIAAFAPNAVAVDGEQVYWATSGTSTLGRANLDGSNVNDSFITGAHQPTGVAVDGLYVYWLNSTGASIGRANLDGSDPDQAFIASAVSFGQGVAVDGGPAGSASASATDLGFGTQPLGTLGEPQSCRVSDARAVPVVVNVAVALASLVVQRRRLTRWPRTLPVTVLQVTSRTRPGLPCAPAWPRAPGAPVGPEPPHALRHRDGQRHAAGAPPAPAPAGRPLHAQAHLPPRRRPYRHAHADHDRLTISRASGSPPSP
jgi:hypothetical protein